MFKKYIEYIKDNPNHYWFKRKLYGWGWTPATKEGWFTILIFIALVMWISFDVDRIEKPTGIKLAVFFIKIIASVIILITICYYKGEKPKWQWGIPIKKE